jgi:ribose transport system ATP-binding protein
MTDDKAAAPGAAANPSGPPILVLRHLSKNFGGAAALVDVDLTVKAGEVHGLLGQNGSGKSTLIKILAGFHEPEPGAELEVNGLPVNLPLRAGEFRALGLSFVHQDLALIPSLTTTENLVIGRLASDNDWRISWPTERRRAQATFTRYKVPIDPDAQVGSIGQIQRAMLAIIRAVEELRSGPARQAEAAGILVLDEATAFLPKTGIEQLFSLIREIVAGGDSVIFVSHNLDEVLKVTDRVTVLRDGRVVGTMETPSASHDTLVEMIVGSRLARLGEDSPRPSKSEVAVAVEGLAGASLLDIGFELHRGEILGLAGLLGAGHEHVPRLLFGAQPASAGRLRIEDDFFDLAKMTPSSAIDAGIALVPADRQSDGSIPTLSVADNVSMQLLDRYFSRLVLDRRRIGHDAGAALRRFQVRPPDPQREYQALSGGNQQKVLLAKWLQTSPRLLLLDEPTIGVDVGARQQIFAILRESAAAGTSILCASSDYEQLAQLCNRVLIIARGRVVRQLEGDELTKERIAEQCLTSVRALGVA